MSVAHKTPKFAGERGPSAAEAVRDVLSRRGAGESAFGKNMNFPLARESRTALATPSKESECSSRKSKKGEELDVRRDARRSGTSSEISEITKKYSNLLDNIQKERLRVSDVSATQKEVVDSSRATQRRNKENVPRSTVASSKSSRSNLQDELNRSIENTINNGDNALKLFNSSSSTCKGEEEAEPPASIRITRKEFVKTTKVTPQAPEPKAVEVQQRRAAEPAPAMQNAGKNQLQSKIDFINSLYDKLTAGPTENSTDRVLVAIRNPSPAEDISSEAPSMLSINRKEMSGEVLANLQEYTFNEESFEVERPPSRSQSQRLLKTPQSSRPSIADPLTISRRSSKVLEVLSKPKVVEEKRRTLSVSRAASEEKKEITFAHVKLERSIKILNSEYAQLKKMPRFVGLLRGNVPGKKDGQGEVSRKDFIEQLSELSEKVESAVKALTALVSGGK